VVNLKKIIGPSVQICVAAFAKNMVRGGETHGGGHHAVVGGGSIPAHGPASAKASKRARASTPAIGQQPTSSAENHIAVDKKGHPEVPHDHAKNNQWIGHSSGANDPHRHLEQPWTRRHFIGSFGQLTRG
jgi:hypothetical protein